MCYHFVGNAPPVAYVLSVVDAAFVISITNDFRKEVGKNEDINHISLQVFSKVTFYFHNAHNLISTCKVMPKHITFAEGTNMEMLFSMMDVDGSSLSASSPCILPHSHFHAWVVFQATSSCRCVTSARCSASLRRDPMRTSSSVCSLLPLTAFSLSLCVFGN